MALGSWPLLLGPGQPSTGGHGWGLWLQFMPEHARACQPIPERHQPRPTESQPHPTALVYRSDNYDRNGINTKEGGNHLEPHEHVGV